jgi:hypothetical protein
MYQALRDFSLYRKESHVHEDYMELVTQFGYVILFGQIFPLAALFSVLTNQIQIRSQAVNLNYMGRTKPEVADGIGSWIKCLEFISHMNVVTNCVMIFYTHKSIRHIVVDPEFHQDNRD